MGLGKSFDVPSYTFFFAVENNLNFWRESEKFSQKSVPSHMFLRCGDYLKFLMGLRKISTKICAQLHVFSLWRLTWVFDGPWKNFHKKVCPVTRFFAVQTILNFWWDLKSFDKKMCPVTRFFAVETLLSVSGTWKVSTKRCDQLHIFFAVQTILSFGWDLEKFRQKCVLSYTFFFAVETNLSFWWDSEKFPQKFVPSYTFFLCGD